jgi:2-hydroxychromene-2-carboxylate isomerase
MSLKSLLMPAISQRLLSRERLLKRRASQERTRVSSGQRHTVHYFHQVDDPYSALAALCLPQLMERYDIDCVTHVVGPPPNNAAPDRERLQNYSRVDALRLARHWGLDFECVDAQPHPASLAQVTAALVTACKNDGFAGMAAPLSQALWQGDAALAQIAALSQAVTLAPARDVQDHLAESDALRQKLGHYLGATLYYAGEWYWGIDRLYHLEARLQDLKAQRPGVKGFMFAPSIDLASPSLAINPADIDFFVSLRSPYSAIVTPRVFALAKHTGAKVKLRFVLPMVMRGLPVPAPKRAYIALDTAREAHARGIPFGRVNDPVGRPTERGLAVLAMAIRQGLGPAFLQSFMQGVWAQGLDAGSDRALKTMVQRCGLAWADAQAALHDNAWREVAEANRIDMLALGLWGVPSFRVGNTAVWGQDRLWAVQDALMNKEI